MSATQEAIELDLTTLPVVDTVTREVREPLTHDDYQQRSHELGALERRITSEELGLKAYSKTKRGEIETLEEERSELIRLLDRGIGRDVECDVRLDESRKLRLIVRRDTGELLAEEPFKSSDYPPPLFAVVEGGDGKPVANSRTIREAFVSTLEGVGGEAVQRLHNDGLLDPTDWELEEAPNAVLPFPTTEILRDHIAEAESNLDEMEATLAQMLADDGCSEADVIAIAINSRTVKTPDEAEAGAIWDKLLEVRDARAAIDYAHGELMRATAEAVEYSDRSEAAGDVVGEIFDAVADQVNSGALDTETCTVTATVTHAPATLFEPLPDDAPVPLSRAKRSGRIEELSSILDVSQLRTAHRCGMLDPTLEDIGRARREIGQAGVSKRKLKTFVDETDVAETALARELKASAKARMAIERRSFPTRAKTIDVLIGEVRWQRARLDVALRPASRSGS